MGLQLFQPSDDFFTDRLVRRYSVVVFIAVAIALAISLSNPAGVTCHTPAYFTDSHFKYAHATCWNQGSFYHINNDYIPKLKQTFKGNRYDLRKMRFLPLILAFQVVFFLLPRGLWKMLTTLIGFSTDRIVTTAWFITKGNGAEESWKCLGTHALSLLQRPFPLLGNTLSSAGGYLLIPSYLLCKLGYSLMCIIQFLIIGAFLNINAFSYGFGRIPWKSYIELNTYTRGNETIFETQHLFPRTGLCEYEVRQMGQVHTYTLQCDINSTDLIEYTLYIIWAWLWICICLLSLSTFAWILRFLAYLLSTKGYKLNRIGILLGNAPMTQKDNTPPVTDDKEMKGFASIFLKPDGYFLLETIEENVSLGAAAQIVTAAWKSYRQPNEQKQATAEQQPSGSIQHQPTQQDYPRASAGGPVIYPIINVEPGAHEATAPSGYHSDNEQAETIPLVEKSSL